VWALTQIASDSSLTWIGTAWRRATLSFTEKNLATFEIISHRNNEQN